MTVCDRHGCLRVLVIGMKYNEEKEHKAKWDAKQKELARIEEAKKREAEKGLFSVQFSCLIHAMSSR